MNKTISSIFAIALSISALVACQKNDGGGGGGSGDGGVQATTPAQNCNIPGTSSDQCNPGTYNQLTNNTFINISGLSLVASAVAQWATVR